MSAQENHISICICTYKRPDLLVRLLNHLADLKTDDRFIYSIVVCDNDQLQSAESIVSDFSSANNIAIKYCVESRQNISLARNMTIANATGNFIAFIDDDEFPDRSWLFNLFDTLENYDVDGVLGPVLRHFDNVPPKWLLKSSLYARPVHPTGMPLDKEKGRTGNVLLKREVFGAQGHLFDPDFRGGGDKEFFRRMIGAGYRFIWSAEAVVYEVVPPIRWKRSFMLRRALFRGAQVPLHPRFGWRQVIKSTVALLAYLVALPIAFLLGQHRFMTILVKMCDHLGLLLAVVGIKPFPHAYITE